MDPLNQTHRSSSKSSSHGYNPTVLPPPPRVVFPIPEPNTEKAPGTLSSGLKRKRPVGDDDSDAGRSYGRLRSTSSFNSNTKAQVREQNTSTSSDRCWHCGATPVDICYVIGSRDHAVSSVQYEPNTDHSNSILVSRCSCRWPNRFPRATKPTERNRTLP